MPTGYTADVADGTVTDFRTFALRCARAFGATVMQRDENMDVPPRRREESDYRANALREAQAKYEQYTAMTEADAQVAMDAERAETIATNLRYHEEHEAKRARYQAMAAQVEAWEPPTTQHIEMKSFMAKQIAESIDFDCGHEYQIPIFDGTPTLWLAERRAKYARDVKYHADEMAKEIERTRDANAWIDALYASLAPATEADVSA